LSGHEQSPVNLGGAVSGTVHYTSLFWETPAPGMQFSLLYWYKGTNTDAAHPHLDVRAAPELAFSCFTGTKVQMLTLHTCI
jgi:hypothetical protein